MQPDVRLPAPEFAASLLGWELLVRDEQGVRGGIIIETEAYTAQDPASHSFKGRTIRNAAMFMAPGTLYVYQIYGLHYCLNITCGSQDGQAVLIRALQPTEGLEYMRAQRGTQAVKNLCSGPAKLVQALGITSALDQTHVGVSALHLRPPARTYQIHTSPRIGIRKATDVPWRFYIA